MSKQKFKGRAADMLAVSRTITEHAKADEEFLSSKRPLWAAPFFDNHLVRINLAFTDIFGGNNVFVQRQTTLLLNKISHGALEDLSDFKVQVIQDFKKDTLRRSEILKMLGLPLLYRAERSQETFIQLLYQFKTNLTDSLRNEIIDKGIAPPIIDRIIAYADRLLRANVTRELLKGSSMLSSQSMDVLNDIYSDTIAIAIIARRFFKGNQFMRDIYSYAITMSKLNNTTLKRKNAVVNNSVQ
jgi:hypothetical protein